MFTHHHRVSPATTRLSATAAVQMQRVWPTAAAVWLCVSSAAGVAALSLTPRPLSRRTLLDTSAAGMFAGGLSCIPQVSNAAAAAALEPGPPGLRLTRADLSRKLSRLVSQ